MIKKKNIPVRQLRELLKQIMSYLPEWVISPVLFFTTMLNFFNDFITILCFIILIGQSARLISKDKKYVDIKVLLFKWVLTISFSMIFGQIQENSIEGNSIKLLFLLVILLIIYPSNVSKSIFNKYFNDEIRSEKKGQMVESAILASSSFLQKVLQNLIIFMLKISKLWIKFIHPVNRKSIEEEITGFDSVLFKQRYDQKIHKTDVKKETFKKQENPQDIIKDLKEIKQTNKESKINFQKKDQKPSVTSNVSQFSTSEPNPKVKDIKDSTYEMKDSIEGMKQSSMGLKSQTSLRIIKDTNVGNKSPTKQLKSAKKYRKYSVSQYLSLFNTTNRSRFMPTTPSTKRCTYYRQIEISYDVDSAVMTVTSLEDMKVSYHNLQEILLLDDLMVQFQFQDNQNMIVKFKSKIQFEEFITAIDVYESGLQK